MVSNTQSDSTLPVTGTRLSPTSPEQHARRLRRLTWIVTSIVLFFVLALSLLWYIGVFGGNVRVVTPGKVYRSAQLTGAHLDRVMEQYGIKTIISLRGGSESDAWYRAEMDSCRRFDAQHVTISMSARRFPAPKELQKLLTAFDTKPYPILFHCNAGADRSGLTGTIYLNLYQNVPLDEAEKRQLTWRYGHISWSPTHAMDDFFTLYRKTNGGLTLRDWITTRYPALYAALPADQRSGDTDLSPTKPDSLRPAPAGAERGRALSPGG